MHCHKIKLAEMLH